MSSVYQSPGDKMRYEILVKSLIEGRLNLAVLSASDLTLDHYANAIHDDLRARGERMVEFCFSADSAKLVEMFNGILSELTVSQARDKQVKSAPKRYLIFRDIMAMQEFELQLLARLVNGFPASNINVVLLVNASASHTSKLQTFGKNLLTWEVEAEPAKSRPKHPSRAVGPKVPNASPGWPPQTQPPPPHRKQQASRRHLRPLPPRAKKTPHCPPIWAICLPKRWPPKARPPIPGCPLLHRPRAKAWCGCWWLCWFPWGRLASCTATCCCKSSPP